MKDALNAKSNYWKQFNHHSEDRVRIFINFLYDLRSATGLPLDQLSHKQAAYQISNSHQNAGFSCWEYLTESSY